LLDVLGADVIKVENPLTAGDDTRSRGRLMSPNKTTKRRIQALISSAQTAISARVHSIFPNRGQETLRKFAIKADVLVEIFKPGALTKFGLDYTRLKKQAQRIVYCSISGLGQGGPNAKNPTTTGWYRPPTGSCRSQASLRGSR